MLVCQLMVWVLAAVKRFDTVVLHAWESARETLSSVLSLGGDREADLG
jgi:hypothetical protein